MAQSHDTFKSFEPRPGHSPCLLPPLLEMLAGAQALPAYFGLDDLREMSKFREIPNVHGLAAYSIEHPAPAGFDPGRPLPNPASTPALPSPGVQPLLTHALSTQPLLLTRGGAATGGDPSARFLIQLIFPQSYAHLAAAFKQMLHPWPQPDLPPNPEPVADSGAAADPIPADYTLIVWPSPVTTRRGRPVLEAFIGHWPGEEPPADAAAPSPAATQGSGLVIGLDDPALIVRLLMDAVARRLAARQNPAALDLSGLEPRVVSGERVSPLWSTPMSPAAALAATAEGRRRALAVGSWLLGVEGDGQGRFPVLESEAGMDGAGWVVAPRTDLE